MNKTLIVAGFVFVAAALAHGQVQSAKPETRTTPSKPSGTAASPEVKVEDFELLDHQGHWHALHRQTGSKAVVLISTANGCPVIKQAAPAIKALREKFASQGIVFWLLDSSPNDDRASIAREAAQLGLDLPVLEDRAQLVANVLGINQTCEVVCIGTTNWSAFYRGAISKELADKKSKVRANQYLEGALTKFIAGKTVSPSLTVAQGTSLRLAIGQAGAPRTISYVDEVAPLLQKNCVSCHSPGNIGPFAMSSYEKVKSRGSMIEEVLLAQRMPPWHADPHYGKFVNERNLTPEQAQTLVRWVEQGAPRGRGEDPLVAQPPPAAQDWPLGQPDFVVKFPHSQKIAASGVFDYRYVMVRSPIGSNVWLRAAVVKPGNRKVVHHILVLVATPDELKNRREHRGQGRGQGGGLNGGGLNGYFTAYVPGYQPVPFPEGSGKLLPADALMIFQVHYTATGKEETDDSELGLYLCAEKPPLELKTRSAFNARFEIPPGAPNEVTEAEFKFEKDAILYDMSPHMHLRGSWFSFEAVYPDGKKEVLLSVPHYDFKWQHLYRLAQPKRVPAGTRLVCRGAHDNSPQNPDNPDPTQTVWFGDQTFNEMFIGYFNYTDAAPAESIAKNSGG